MKEGKTFKRILAIALVIVMSITMVPFGVYAEGEACTHPSGFETVDEVAATCTTDGKLAHKVCKDNGCLVLDGAVVTEAALKIPAAHKWSTEWIDGVRSTCTVNGSKGYFYCTETGCNAKCNASYVILETIELPLAEHTWDNGTVTTAATCKAEGVKTYTCSVCGGTKTEPIAKSNEHTMTAATCLAPATCSVCGKTEGDALGHSYGADGKCTRTGCNATHTHTGGTATCQSKAKCDECGEFYGERANHAYSETFTEDKAPTCTTAGSKSKHCLTSGCDAQTEVTPVAATGHKFDKTKADGICTVADCNAVCPHNNAEEIPEVKATCTTSGSTLGYKCADCGNVRIAPKEIKALGHDVEIIEGVAPTCTETGKSDGQKCKREGCDYKVEQSTLNALGHAWSTEKKQIVAPTCTTKGSKAIVCTRTDCGEVQPNTTEPVDELPHDYTGQTETVTVEATCTAKGEKAILCKSCKTAKKEGSVKEIAALGHDWDGGTVKKEPTCTTKGSTTYKCNRCKTTEDREVAALGHDIEEQVTEATCTTDGYTTFKCKECDYYYVDDVVEAFGHSFITYVYDENSATCYQNGTKTAECDYCCGAKDQIEDPDSKIEHQLTEFTTLKAATCTEEGEEEAKCFYYDKCGYTESYPTDPLGHTITDKTEFTVDKAPSCTEKGSQSKHCERCEYTEGAEEIPALGHDYKDAPGTTATCTKGGYAKFVCSRCSDSYEEVNAEALGHDWNEGKVVVEPKCEEKGKATYTCMRCAETEDRDVDALGHSAGEAIVIPATTEANGSSIKTCIRCSKEMENVEIAKIAKLSLKYKKATYNGEAKLPKLTITDANGNKLVKGTDYTVVIPTKEESAAIGAHTYTVTFMGNYEGEEEVSYKVLPGTSSKVSATKKQTEIKLSWKAVKGAVGYRVYVYNTKTKKYDIVAKYVKGKTTYTVKDLKANTTYKFAIKAYGKDDEGKVIWAAESLKASFKTLVTKTSKLVATPSTTSVKLSWKKVSGADGYRVYVYNAKTKKYSIVEKNVTGTSYTVKGLKSGTSYKFAVKAYDTVSKKTVWSNQYTTVSVKTK